MTLSAVLLPVYWFCVGCKTVWDYASNVAVFVIVGIAIGVCIWWTIRRSNRRAP